MKVKYNFLKNNITLSKLVWIFLIIFFSGFFSSCGPVNALTRVKKTPRKYSLNYCGIENIRAPKTEINLQPWIVFADHDNISHTTPGGKIKAQDVSFMDPFLVVKRKGNYLKLIKYTPEVYKNGKLDHKKAEFYGWMHKSLLLLNQQSATDIASGKKNKMLVSLSDAVPIHESEKFFVQDSVISYRDFNKKSVANNVPPFSVVYQLKQNDEYGLTLISKKPYLKADDVKNEVIGWVDNSLIKGIGQGLHIDINARECEEKQFFSKHFDELYLNRSSWNNHFLLSQQYPTLKHNPVITFGIRDTVILNNLLLPMPALDKSRNYIFNVNGGQISHSQFITISKEMKNINIGFVFEGKKGAEGRSEVIEHFPQIVNALQSLQPLFENDAEFNYKFSCVMAFDDNPSEEIFISPVMQNYSQLINLLTEKSDKKSDFKVRSNYKPWTALNTATKMFKDTVDAVNLMIVIGETGDNDIRNELLYNLSSNNCRILGFQIYAERGRPYDNFVLNIEKMINSYSKDKLKTRGDVFVSPKQVKKENYYTTSEEEKNIYTLDFPENSVTQGGILFPQKNETLSMELLTNNIDTIIKQIKKDNNDIIMNMIQAFNTVGDNRTRFDELFIDYYSLDTTIVPSKKLLTSFKNNQYGWFLPTRIFFPADDVINMRYRLMLSESELNDMKDFVSDLSKLEVNYTYQRETQKIIAPKPCNCPDDDFITLDDLDIKTNIQLNDTIPPEYESTIRIRRHIYNMYMKPLRQCKICKESKKKLKNLTIAEAQRRITGCPTYTESLNSIYLKDIKNIYSLTNEQLEELIEYFKEKKHELEKAEKFESNNENYYWVDGDLFP